MMPAFRPLVLALTVVALAGCAGLDAPLRIIEPPTPMGAQLAGYIGAVAISGDGRLLAASAPRAGRIVYVDTERSVST